MTHDYRLVFDPKKGKNEKDSPHSKAVFLHSSLEQCLFLHITPAQLTSALNIILVVNYVRALPGYTYQPKWHLFIS